MRHLFFLLFFIASGAKAQVNVQNSSVSMPFLGFNYSFSMPGNDLSDRFGANSGIGGDFLYKTKSNFVFGADLNYLFGNRVKEFGLFDSISSNTGSIIDKSGNPAEIRLYERGWLSSVKGGKIFSILSPNPNSGILAIFSLGFIQHKIRIEDVNNNIPQIDGEYIKGYDRLTSGYSLSQFLGYIYFGSNRLINFYAGLEITEGFTKSRRSFDFDRMAPDTQKRKDMLYGIKAGWILPLYRKAPKEFYYY